MSLFGKTMIKMKDDAAGKAEESSGISAEQLEELSDMGIATAALSVFAAASDGTISLDEYLDMDIQVGRATGGVKLPDDAREAISRIFDKHSITWEEVKYYLDKISVDKLQVLAEAASKIADSDSEVSDDEKKVMEKLGEYIKERA
ncbi:MAG: TerB family tellurite resistance protein [Eubacterium sp.]|nr:TerB family tellurite resistance protein [Eubacterium sp.]